MISQLIPTGLQVLDIPRTTHLCRHSNPILLHTDQEQVQQSMRVRQVLLPRQQEPRSTTEPMVQDALGQSIVVDELRLGVNPHNHEVGRSSQCWLTRAEPWHTIFQSNL